MQQIIDISWKYNQSSKKYSQTLKLFDSESSDIKVLPLENLKFDWKLSSERYCPGYYLDSKYYPCPNNAVLEKKSYQNCYFCENQVGFRSAFLFGQKPNENMQKYLAQDHYIYLAWFNPDKIKVGTAASQRQFIRPIEQDALVYAFIAKSDGFNIQKLERAISTHFEVTEFVNSSFKFKSLGIKTKDDKPQKLIEAFFKKIKDYYKNNTEFSNWIFDWKDVETVDLRNLEEVFYPESSVKRLSVDKLLKEDKFIPWVGNFLGLRGRYSIFENDSKLYAFDERDIIGRKIEGNIETFSYDTKEPENKGQLGLF